MRRPACFFLLLLLIFINFNCNTRQSPTKEKPGSVTLVAAVADTSVLEAGIDAIPDGDLIRIEWSAGDASTAFFEVYRGADPAGQFSKVVTLEMPSQMYEDQVPARGVRYYFFVRPVNDEGVRGDPSDTLNYRLIMKAQILGPAGSASVTPTFSWRDPNSPQANDYIIRLKEASSGRTVWISEFQNSNFGPENKSVAFNADGRARLGSLAPGTEYLWRIDVVGNEKNCGSESPWTSIQIQ
jgi:hypothetical protein